MRKFLFCAGLLAFAASCSNDELASISQEESAKGITFTVVDDAATRGELGEMTNGKFPYFWYAETDRINIWSVKTKMGTSTSGKDAWSDWSDWTGQAVYKATQSKANGVFTAIDDANTLNFASKIEAGDDEATVKSKTATFIATYPSTMTISGVETNATDNSIVESITLADLPALTSQTVDENIGQIAMYSHTTGKKENSYDAVGEKINLKFIRPFTAALFKTKGINAEYSTIFGNLNSIELEMKGYDDKDDTKDIDPSYLYYGSKASYKITDIEKNEGKFIVGGKTEGNNDFDWTGDSNDPATSITLNVGKEWNDSKNAFMAISRIDREGFRDKGVKETVEVTYSFANITFTETYPTDSNWPCPAEGETSAINVFVGMPALDMANYPYLVTNMTGVSSNDRSLLVNSGKFEEALIEEGSTVSVEWPINSGKKVALTEFQTIISKVELTDKDLKKLKSFTNLKYVRLDENETLPAETFRGLDLDTLNMAKLTEIKDANAFKAADASYTGLKVVRLPKYTFPKTTINNVILKEGALQKLDMSGVETMKSKFPAEGFSLSGFGELTYVKVKNGVELGSSAFNGCTKLKSVDGTVDITKGAGAFENSGITEITITGTVVPANAFKKCKDLKKVNQGTGTFRPTEVGNAAFSESGIVNIDLSGVTELGEEAFMGCASLVGVERSEGLNVLTVGATKISKNAFKSCTTLKYVEFTNATSIAEGILNGATLNEVKFVKVLTEGAVDKDMFGTTTNTKLFLNPKQSTSWYEGNSFYPKGDKGANIVTKIDFKSIIFEGE